MYLKEITAIGFKSFADKINIELDNKITCIVGPNGSGKSNVVDAVRWVLGEQSVKSLRGDGAMSDVIFSGSKSRNKLNVASVELIFDNSDNYVNMPYNEISIKRKVYRSGENEYSLNGERCRLKDIVNLLLDTGIGKESFNIISQGEVDKILSSSANDRRVIFEEASGILKYKKRKEEAVRKLDRTHNNLDRVNDIIAELEGQVEPLREQSEKAKEYLDNKNALENLEVALLAYEIDKMNTELKEAQTKKEKIEKEISVLESESSVIDTKQLEKEKELTKLESKLRTKQDELLKVTGEVERLNGEKKLIEERSSHKTSENEALDKMRELLENIKILESDIKLIDEGIKNADEKISSLDKESGDYEKEIDRLVNRKKVLEDDYSMMNRDVINLNNKIESLRLEKDNVTLPYSVKNIINNDSLTGIYNTIGNSIDIDDQYLTALDIAVSANKNFIIVENEEDATKAINYLKEKKLGRATFFPISVIKERFVDSETLKKIEKDKDFVDVLDNLLTYNNKYAGIMKNQFGNILVSPDIEAAKRLAKKINHRYKIITLDGDVINIGGSMSGGSKNKVRSIFLIKQEIKDTKVLLEEKKVDIDKTLENISQKDEEIKGLEEKVFTLSKKKAEIEQVRGKKNSDRLLLNEKLSSEQKDYDSYKAISNNTLEKEEEKTINSYYEAKTKKATIESEIKALTKEVEDLKVKIDEENAKNKLRSSNLHAEEKEYQKLEILINRLDVKLDNMLLTLNEDYALTFEKAKDKYKLEIEPDIAREKVNKHKNVMKALGMVNLGAIEEFERVNTRFEFLNNQKEDLLKAEDTLLEIMEEMDEVMEEEFAKTFEEIKVEFKKVFKELFGGGDASLKLTDPDNLLTTGVEIVASPPGKKLTTISLLSGGEKTLTAISLLFSILNVRKIPFCLFDEVEAALDEANVDQFGHYLSNYKDKTQFLIITHKKKTMEYADTLYGITMQESGVSKLVSVRLKDK